MSDLNAPEPAPIPNESGAIWPKVIEDMCARDQTGRKKYGTPLQAFNGRDPLVDMYQEGLDLVVYARQAIEEREALKNVAARIRRQVVAMKLQSKTDLMKDVNELVGMILGGEE